jgi:hypothetical protein
VLETNVAEEMLDSVLRIGIGPEELPAHWRGRKAQYVRERQTRPLSADQRVEDCLRDIELLHRQTGATLDEKDLLDLLCGYGARGLTNRQLLAVVLDVDARLPKALPSWIRDTVEDYPEGDFLRYCRNGRFIRPFGQVHSPPEELKMPFSEADEEEGVAILGALAAGSGSLEIAGLVWHGAVRWIEGGCENHPEVYPKLDVTGSYFHRLLSRARLEYVERRAGPELAEKIRTFLEPLDARYTEHTEEISVSILELIEDRRFKWDRRRGVESGLLTTEPAWWELRVAKQMDDALRGEIFRRRPEIRPTGHAG